MANTVVIKNIGDNHAQVSDQALHTKSIVDGEEASAQNPIPADGDSVYVKDLDLDRSDNGNFLPLAGREGSGTVADYFNSLTTVNCNSSSDNPKIIKVQFQRTIQTSRIGFGCDDLTKGFGHVGDTITIKVIGSGDQVRTAATGTIANPNSFVIDFEPQSANGVIIEFNCPDEVCLSNIIIYKSTNVNSRLQGTAPDGLTKDVNVTVDGDLTVSDNSSGLAIAKGLVTGHSVVQKFGAAPDFDSGDGIVSVWDGAEDNTAWELMRYVYSTTADIDSISSTSTSDTQEMSIQGLDSDYNLVDQNVTLNGQNRVALTTPLIRIFRAFNNNSIDLSGHVIVYVNGTISGGVPTNNSDIRAVVDPINQQTEMAIYTVPAGKTAYLTRGYASTAGANRSSNYVIRFYARQFGKVFRLQNVNAISENGNSIIVLDYFAPLKIPEKTDIEVRVNTTASPITGASISAGFDLVLVDN